MVAKKPITSLADVKGLKLRLHPDDLSISVWRELGANTIVLAWTEIYESMSRGIVARRRLSHGPGGTHEVLRGCQVYRTP